MRDWIRGRPASKPRLKTGRLYRWLRHPMYVGVLMGVWMTPRMSLGHALLALGLTGYVLIAMRYEERDLARTFGVGYNRWPARRNSKSVSAPKRRVFGTDDLSRSGLPDRAEDEPNHSGHCQSCHRLVGDRLVDRAFDIARHFLYAFGRLAALVRHAAGDVLGLTCEVLDGARGFVSQIVDLDEL
jgi:hypothetical protein